MKMKAQAFLFLLISLLVDGSHDFGSSSVSSQVKYESIISFGDSVSDTGNYLAVDAPGFPPIRYPPYGDTFFEKVTGRASDGRLIVDFLAEAFGLRFLSPHLKQDRESNVKTGENFAVFGATALDPEFYNARNLGPYLFTTDSLSVQVDRFKKWKSSICTTKEECGEFFEKSLFMVGEIGGNDYNLPLLLARAPIEQVRPLVPVVVEAIINATAELIEEGAVHIIVPGNFPIGCVPVYLTRFLGSNPLDYNPTTGCLDNLNEFSKYHNTLLVEALERMRKIYRHAQIIYADYYGASIGFYTNPKLYGFYGGSIVACCGGGGPYNFNESSICSAPGSTVCTDPSSYVSWDGIHWTEAAYRHIAKGLVHGPFAYPALSQLLQS